MTIEGQLSHEERRLLVDVVTNSRKKPRVILEVGTWLGGGSTLHFLRALASNAEGHLWGIEADPGIYAEMMQNIRRAAPEATDRFTGLLGFSTAVIPDLLQQQGPEFQIDVAFLDGADNPLEQIREFHLIADRIPIGGVLLAHDAKMRKGKWLVPFVTQLDNWESKVLDSSEVGLLYATKIAEQPSKESRLRAQAVLRKCRREPLELVAALLPQWVCVRLWQILPQTFLDRFSGGLTSNRRSSGARP